MIKKIVGGILVIGVIGVVLGGGSDETSTSEPVEEVQSSRCIAVSSSLLTTLSEGDGFDLKNGYAVKSNDWEDNVYYVSAEFTNSGSLGVDGEVITWWLFGELDSPDLIEGIGGFGEEYSTWGASNQNKKGSPYDDGYSDSRDCVK
jgi:hypothetical protein